MAWTIDRPSPLPLRSLFGLAALPSRPPVPVPLSFDPRWNRSNACAACSVGHARPRIGDLQQHPLTRLGQPDGHRRARRGVLPHVAEQVGEDLPDARLVHHRQQVRRGLGVDRPGGLHRPGVGHRVPHQHGEIGLDQVQGRHAVQPGELEQLGDEPAHPVRLLLDAAHRVRQPVRPEGALPVQLGVAADGGQRGAELVRGVGGELAHLLLRGQPGIERLLDPVQHRVDGRGQPACLGPVTGVRHPGGQVAAGGDLVGGGGHPVQRRQSAADDPGPEQREQPDEHGAGDDLGDDDLAQRCFPLAQRPGHDDDGPAQRDHVLIGLGGRPGQAPHGAKRRPVREVDGERGSRGRGKPAGGPGRDPLVQVGRELAGHRGGSADRGRAAGRVGVVRHVAVGGSQHRHDGAPGRDLELRVEHVADPLAERQRGDQAEDQEENRADGEQRGQQPGTQRQSRAAVHPGSRLRSPAGCQAAAGCSPRRAGCG